MPNYYPILKAFLLLSEIAAAIVGLYYFSKLKDNHWKLFVYYLILIASQECFWHLDFGIDSEIKNLYYAYVGFPVQYIFFYWLYSKSLKNKKIFLYSTTFYLSTYIPIVLFTSRWTKVYSPNITIGTLALFVLVILEFKKQIRDDSILHFYKNNMFYINLGIILLYIGTFPLFCFYITLAREYFEIWLVYFTYFLVANILMYSLFALSFIWGKHHLK